MSPGRRAALFVVVVAVALTAGIWFGVRQYSQTRSAATEVTEVAIVPLDRLTDVARVAFRSTAPGQDHGKVAFVALEDPSGPRAFTPVACDRVYASTDGAVCLVTERGVATRFTAHLLAADLSISRTWPLPGIPSRARLSPDGTLVATTSFVTGHSYASTGFATETEIRGTDGTEHGNIEDFALIVDGAPIAPVDRNLWGVSFVDDGTFYATAQSRSLGRTWLVEGDLGARTLTALREGAECPSVSPDGSRLAYKTVVATSPVVWNIAVLDLATGTESVLSGEERNVDDQVEWLDDSTLLYGLPRVDEPGVTDVWSIAVETGAQPAVFIPEAWSPSVVRAEPSS